MTGEAGSRVARMPTSQNRDMGHPGCGVFRCGSPADLAGRGFAVSSGLKGVAGAVADMEDCRFLP